MKPSARSAYHLSLITYHISTHPPRHDAPRYRPPRRHGGLALGTPERDCRRSICRRGTCLFLLRVRRSEGGEEDKGPSARGVAACAPKRGRRREARSAAGGQQDFQRRAFSTFLSPGPQQAKSAIEVKAVDKKIARTRGGKQPDEATTGESWKASTARTIDLSTSNRIRR